MDLAVYITAMELVSNETLLLLLIFLLVLHSRKIMKQSNGSVMLMIICNSDYGARYIFCNSIRKLYLQHQGKLDVHTKLSYSFICTTFQLVIIIHSKTLRPNLWITQYMEKWSTIIFDKIIMYMY